MRKILIIVICIWFVIVACDQKRTANQPSTEVKAKITKTDIKSLEDKASYGMGYNMGKRFIQLGFDIDPELFSQGISDVSKETATPLMTEEEIAEAIKDYQEKIRNKKMKERDKKATENKVKGKAFLEENKKKKGVVTLESGLQYTIIKEGTGKKPKATDRVKVHYKGTTIHGEEFDSSFKRNKPAIFPVNRVVGGWTEALQLMPVGSKWELCIPAELGYGARGQGNKIDPNATLLFEIELISIEPPTPRK